MDTSDRRQDLVAELDRLISLLAAYGETHWVDWLTGDRRRLAQGDLGALGHLGAAFGGMGSLNDLVIHPANGHPIDPASVDGVNGELTRLRSEVSRLARSLGGSSKGG